MEFYRLSKRKYANNLSGIGAAIAGGRWNSEGVEMLYVSSHPALALLELLRRFTPSQIPSSTCIVQYGVPDKLLSQVISPESLPEGWNSNNHILQTKKIGDRFIQEEKHFVMSVPSVIIPSQKNYLLNPNHKDIAHVKIIDILANDINYHLLQDVVEHKDL